MNELLEKRNNLLDEMDALIASAKTETRALSDEESTRFDSIKTEISQIDKTLQADEESRSFEKKEVVKMNQEQETRALEEQNFVAFIKGESRAFTTGDNGAIIPTHIANRIIEQVKERAELAKLTTQFYVGGDLAFPAYDESTSTITAAYYDDLTEVTESNAKFTTVKLESHIVGVLAKVSNSLINRTDFDVLSYVIGKVADSIVEFIEKELISGTTKVKGLATATQEVTAASATVLTADELIDLQMTVPQRFQANAVWIMSTNTLKAIRKLKGDNAEYLLNKDIRSGFGYELLGRPVLVSDDMSEIATGNLVVAFGDMSGIYTKLANNVQVKVLQEKYATQYATGVLAHVELDAKIVEQQKVAVLKMA